MKETKLEREANWLSVCAKGTRHSVDKLETQLGMLLKQIARDTKKQARDAKVHKWTAGLLGAMWKVLKAMEWTGNNGKCPVCVGWNMSEAGETPGIHTPDCDLHAVLKQARVRKTNAKVRRQAR